MFHWVLRLWFLHFLNPSVYYLHAIKWCSINSKLFKSSCFTCIKELVWKVSQSFSEIHSKCHRVFIKPKNYKFTERDCVRHFFLVNLVNSFRAAVLLVICGRSTGLAHFCLKAYFKSHFEKHLETPISTLRLIAQWRERKKEKNRKIEK